MGEVDLFFPRPVDARAPRKQLLEALASHLAGAMENLRADALEREAAVGEERRLLARELHDSIAQSLAFLKIQVQLMRDGGAARAGRAGAAASLDEIDTGVRESIGDVRELLVHFRTRTNAEDIEPALQDDAAEVRAPDRPAGRACRCRARACRCRPTCRCRCCTSCRRRCPTCASTRAPRTSGWTCSSGRSGASRCATTAAASTPSQARGETHVGLQDHARARRTHRCRRCDVVSTPGAGTSVDADPAAPSGAIGRRRRRAPPPATPTCRLDA